MDSKTRSHQGSCETALSFHSFAELIRLAAEQVSVQSSSVDLEQPPPSRISRSHAARGEAHSRSRGFKALQPPSNTGLLLQRASGLEISLDYLALTGRLEMIEEVRLLCRQMASKFLEKDAVVFTEDESITIGRRYAHTARTPNGLLFAYTKSSDNNHYDVRIAIPSKVLKRVDFRFTWLLLNSLRLKGFKPTRLDVALDDYLKRLHPELILEAIQKKNVVRLKTFRRTDIPGSLDGFTIYLGSRQSLVMFRYYDKFTESKGAIDCWRLEAELKEEVAVALWEAMFVYNKYREDWIKSLFLEAGIFGNLDFRDRSQDQNISRCEQLSWWRCFIEDCSSHGGVRLPRTRHASTLQKKFDWIGKQVETSLALIDSVVGHEGMLTLLCAWISSGRKRFSDVHRAILKLHSEHGVERLSICYNEH